MKKIYLLIAIVTLVGNLFSYSLLDREVGNMVNIPDARLQAMGGAGTAGSTSLMGALLNPAGVVGLEDGFGAQFSAGVMKNDDDRAFPMFDFFDGYVDDATYASNTNYYDEYSFAANYRLSRGYLAMGVGYSYLPFMNFEANYEEEVRDDGNSDGFDYPKVLAYNIIEGKGSVNAHYYSLAVSYKNRYSLGIHFGMLKGDNTYRKEIHWTDAALIQNSSVEDFNEKKSVDYNGSLFKVGARTQINERINLGFSFQPEIKLDADVKMDSILTSETLNLPPEMRAGLVYMPRNIARTYFNLDVEMVGWNSINDVYDNVLNYYLGVEHKFQYGVPFRFGFRYVTEYRSQAGTYSEKITMPTITAGTGFMLRENLHLDLSVEYMNREYEAMDLFMDGFYDHSGLWQDMTPTDRLSPDTVTENLIKVQTSLSFKW